MKKPEIAKMMARHSGETSGEAADRLDQLVMEILDGVRRGEQVRLPGLGSFVPGTGGRIAFKREAGRQRG